MRIRSQNLNEKYVNNRRQVAGSMFWHGRAWLNRKYREHTRNEEICHIEWLFGRRTKTLALTADFGRGDSDAGLVINLAVPFLFSIYLCFPCVYRCKESKVGISFHMGGIHLYTFTTMMESNSNDPWWKRSHSWYWPWELRHHLTEILKPQLGIPSSDWPVVWSDAGKKFMDSYEERKKAEQSVNESHPYIYHRKNGQIQNVTATIHVTRMTWRARWWPIIPIKKVSTSIDVSFDKEVGEGVDGWKGGVVGCGHNMLPFETPLETLRRMEKEVKFNR